MHCCGNKFKEISKKEINCVIFIAINQLCSSPVCLYRNQEKATNAKSLFTKIFHYFLKRIIVTANYLCIVNAKFLLQINFLKKIIYNFK